MILYNKSQSTGPKISSLIVFLLHIAAYNKGGYSLQEVYGLFFQYLVYKDYQYDPQVLLKSQQH